MRQRQTQNKPTHQESITQTQAHQPIICELLDYFFKNIVEENCVIFDEGMNGVNVKLCYMTEYVRTLSGKTISIRCDRRQRITRIKDEIERNTRILLESRESIE